MTNLSSNSPSHSPSTATDGNAVRIGIWLLAVNKGLYLGLQSNPLPCSCTWERAGCFPFQEACRENSSETHTHSPPKWNVKCRSWEIGFAQNHTQQRSNPSQNHLRYIMGMPSSIDPQWIGHKEANVKNLFDTLALLVVLALSFQLCALISVSCRSRDCRGTTHFSSVYRWQTNITEIVAQWPLCKWLSSQWKVLAIHQWNGNKVDYIYSQKVFKVDIFNDEDT